MLPVCRTRVFVITSHNYNVWAWTVSFIVMVIRFKGKSAYCLCASRAMRMHDVSRDVSTMTSQRIGTLRAAVIFPAIWVLLRHGNFIGVRFIEIDNYFSESGESETSHTCFEYYNIWRKKNVLIFKFVSFSVSKTSHIYVYISFLKTLFCKSSCAF